MDPLEEDKIRELADDALDRYRAIQDLISQPGVKGETFKENLRQATIEAGETLSEARAMVLRDPWDCLLAVLRIPALAATTYMTAFEATRTRR